MPECLKVPFPTKPVFATPPPSTMEPGEPERVPPPGPAVETGGGEEDVERPQAAPGPPPPVEPSSSPPIPLSLDDLDKLMALASQGDAAARASVQNFLAEGGSAEWRRVGDLAEMAQRVLATKLFPTKAAYALSVQRNYDELREQLGDEDSTPLEKLAIERIVAAKMLADALDLLGAGAGEAGVTSAKFSKAQETAEKRLHLALRSLQLAREICRGAASRGLRVVGSTSEGTPAPSKRAATG